MRSMFLRQINIRHTFIIELTSIARVGVDPEDPPAWYDSASRLRFSVPYTNEPSSVRRFPWRFHTCWRR